MPNPTHLALQDFTKTSQWSVLHSACSAPWWRAWSWWGDKYRSCYRCPLNRQCSFAPAEVSVSVPFCLRPCSCSLIMKNTLCCLPQYVTLWDMTNTNICHRTVAVCGDIRGTIYVSTAFSVEVCCRVQAVLWGRSIQLQQQQYCSVCSLQKSITVRALGTNLSHAMLTSICMLKADSKHDAKHNMDWRSFTVQQAALQ